MAAYQPPAGSPFNAIPGTNVPVLDTNWRPPGSQGMNNAFPDAGHVTISPDILKSMGQYSDAAYQQAASRLDPQWAQQKAQFDQQMVGQGVQPGSEAYNAAYGNFSRGQNDAYAGARNAAMQQGLAAQGQAFNQGFQNSSLQNQLSTAKTAADASMFDAMMNSGAGVQSAQIGANASMFNNSQNNQTNQLLGLGNLGLGYGNLQLGQGQLGLGYDRLNADQSQNDFNNLSGLMNYGRGGDVYNNSLPGQQMQNMQSMFGFVPNGNPYQTDVTGAYGLQQGGQNANYNAASQQANGTNQMLGSLGSAAMMALMFS